jgi:23S rRNA pseudouridine1911/1915/1917 synthase
MQRLIYTVAPPDRELPLASLVARQFGSVGITALERGGVWLGNQRITDTTMPLPVGAQLVVRLPPATGYAALTIGPADILFEDAWLIAVHKQAGWYVGATPWDDHAHVRAALGRYLAQRDGQAPPLHLAHQLDRDTSGLLLLSKDPAINPTLQAAFAHGTIHKRYYAICAGHPPLHGTICTGHGRAAGGRWRVYPREEVGNLLPAGGGRIKLAATSYRALARSPTATLLDLTLHTGRTHQIRLHMAHLGHPLLGDLRYGGASQYATWHLSGHLLHAEQLALTHPQTGAALLLRSPLPSPLAEISRMMQWYADADDQQ